MDINENPIELSDKNENQTIIEKSQVPLLLRRIKLQAIAAILIIIILVITGVMHYRYTKTDIYRQQKVDRQTQRWIKDIKKLIMLPETQPAAFIVDDPDILIAEQPFFTGAERGDLLLVYPESKKAILYSPNRNIIVNVGPVDFSQGE